MIIEYGVSFTLSPKMSVGGGSVDGDEQTDTVWLEGRWIVWYVSHALNVLLFACRSLFLLLGVAAQGTCYCLKSLSSALPSSVATIQCCRMFDVSRFRNLLIWSFRTLPCRSWLASLHPCIYLHPVFYDHGRRLSLRQMSPKWDGGCPRWRPVHWHPWFLNCHLSAWRWALFWYDAVLQPVQRVLFVQMSSYRFHRLHIDHLVQFVGRWLPNCTHHLFGMSLATYGGCGGEDGYDDIFHLARWLLSALHTEKENG